MGKGSDNNDLRSTQFLLRLVNRSLVLVLVWFLLSIITFFICVVLIKVFCDGLPHRCCHRRRR